VRARAVRGVWYRGVLFVRDPDGQLRTLAGQIRLDALVDDCIEKCLNDDDSNSDDGNEKEDRNDA